MDVTDASLGSAVKEEEAAWAQGLLSHRMTPERAPRSAPSGSDQWILDPPASWGVVALAVPPTGRGLLVSRWTNGRAPVVTYVPPAGGDERAGAAELIAELSDILAEARDRAGAGATVGEGEREESAATTASKRAGALTPHAAATEGTSSKAASTAKGTGSTEVKHVVKLVPLVAGFETVVLNAENASRTFGKHKRHGSGCTIDNDNALADGCILSLVATGAEESTHRFQGSLPAYKVEVKSSLTREERLQRSQYWAHREALDGRMKQLSDDMQRRLLKHATGLLVPPPVDATERAALDDLAATAEEMASRDGYVTDPGLMHAACLALPCLEDADLTDALSGALATRDGANLSAGVLERFLKDLREAWATAAASHTKASFRTVPGSSPDGTGERMPLVLLLDASLNRLPWEVIPVLRSHGVCRLPCSAFLKRPQSQDQPLQATEDDSRSEARAPGDPIVVNAGSTYYLLNPGGDLARTETTFAKRFATAPGWVGAAGSAPSPETLAAELQAHDLYVYCGHGDGGKFLPAERLQRLPRCAAAFLMGCSSGAIQAHGGLAPTGMALAYLHARCPALVANLWDVTDGESDRFCTTLLEALGAAGSPRSAVDEPKPQSKSLLLAVARAREGCKLKFLTGAAAVTYGVPVDIRPGVAEPSSSSRQPKASKAPKPSASARGTGSRAKQPVAPV